MIYTDVLLICCVCVCVRVCVRVHVSMCVCARVRACLRLRARARVFTSAVCQSGPCDSVVVRVPPRPPYFSELVLSSSELMFGRCSDKCLCKLHRTFVSVSAPTACICTVGLYLHRRPVSAPTTWVFQLVSRNGFSAHTANPRKEMIACCSSILIYIKLCSSGSVRQAGYKQKGRVLISSRSLLI
jgi:hypothetical protein